MAVETPERKPVPVLKARQRTRYWALFILLMGALSYIGVFWVTTSYLGARSPNRWAWLALAVLFLALALRTFRRGITADNSGVVVRNLIRRHEIPWSDLSGIDFKQVDTPWVSAFFYRLVFVRQDGTRVTSDAPGGGKAPGESLFMLRERLLAMQQTALDSSSSAMTSEPPPTAPVPVARQRRLVRVGIFFAGAVAAAAVFLAFNMFRGSEPPAPATSIAAAGATSTSAAPTLPGSPSSAPSSPAPSADPKGAATTPAAPLVKPKRIYWEQLKRRMCVRVPRGQDFQFVSVVDCRAEHDVEVIATGAIPGTSRWPGDDAVGDAASKTCTPAFTTYVGVPVEVSRFDWDYFTVNQGGWTTGPQTLICIVYDPSGDTLTKSVRNTRE